MTHQLPIPIPRDQVSIVNLVYIDAVGSMVNIWCVPGADPTEFLDMVCRLSDAEPEDVMPCIWHLTAVYPSENMTYSVVTHSYSLGSTLLGTPTMIRGHANIGAPYCRPIKLRPLDSDGTPVYAVYDHMNFIGIRLDYDEDGELTIVNQETPEQRYPVDELLSGKGDALADEIAKFLSETDKENGQ